MRLIEQLLRRGVPLTGIGTQTHIDVDLPDGATAAAVRDLAEFGLPIHIAEVDISTGRRRDDFRSRQERLVVQAVKATEAAEAFMALPPAQRFAFTVWGARDRDSWLRRPPNAGDGTDQPLFFTDAGQPKRSAAALAQVFRAGS